MYDKINKTNYPKITGEKIQTKFNSFGYVRTVSHIYTTLAGILDQEK